MIKRSCKDASDECCAGVDVFKLVVVSYMILQLLGQLKGAQRHSKAKDRKENLQYSRSHHRIPWIHTHTYLFYLSKGPNTHTSNFYPLYV